MKVNPFVDEVLFSVALAGALFVAWVFLTTLGTVVALFVIAHVSTPDSLALQVFARLVERACEHGGCAAG